MKKILILMAALACLNAAAQEPSYTVYKGPRVTAFGGPMAQLSFLGPEAGAVAGISIKDRFLVGGFSQFSFGLDGFRGSGFHGSYLQWTMNPYDYYMHVGLSAKIGISENRYLGFDPAVEAQRILSDRTKLCFSAGITAGMPSVQVKLLVGNFATKYWSYYHMRKKAEHFKKKMEKMEAEFNSTKYN